MMTEKTPVLLLTGYLGSGKTTLLNRILSNSKGIKFAVIVNDIGEVNIDASLIQQGGVVGMNDDSLVALQNGCICCTLKMDLVQQLHDIIATHRFDYIVIEASGICEPGPIAQTIDSIPRMEAKYNKEGIPQLDCIVTVVDALRIRDEFGCGDDLVKKNIGEEDLENLVIQQIEFCNIVLLNKASEVSAEELLRIRKVVRALQPRARILECNYGDIELENILNTGMFDFEKVATSATWIQEIEKRGDELEDEHEHHHHHDHEHHHHHDHEGGEVEEYGIGTYVYYARKPMDLNRFDWFVSKKWPKGVIRTKGMCYFTDEFDICYLFEQAGKQMSLKNAGQWYATMPENQLANMLRSDPTLAADWDETYGDRMQKLVFIGQNLDKAYIKKELDACLVD
ncbi:MAG: GTP-binding protein [Bacteroidaceae bacterium]|nr:GTP-binding protein [Bacteroidaceae bacterium]MBR6856917.1 GTP-binding protein [Bacteroidaceae bacterium]